MDRQSHTAHPNHRTLGPAPVPSWVPDAVQRYLTHTETGLPIREVARRSGCHASTVLRQIRKIETRRDDPLVDRALVALSSRFFHGPAQSCATPPAEETYAMGTHVDDSKILNDASQLDREAGRVLRRLCEAGAVLAVAEGMETAVVVRDSLPGMTLKTCSVAAHFVAAMALNDWIDCAKPGRITRYTITPAGRSKLADLEVLQTGTGADFGDQQREFSEKTVQDGPRRRRIRYNAAESPVTLLARRRAKDGAPFLGDSLVTAAERLREDFELAQMGPRVTQNWDHFLTGSDRTHSAAGADARPGPAAARNRVAAALRYLGPGLGDVALRCCCYLEGLEAAEKRMGWSARSGKIVLRIALQRLNQFYTTEVGEVLVG